MASARLQAMDLTSLRAVLSELRPWVEPSRFEKAQQVDPHTVQLGLRTLEGHLWLELSWQAEAPRFLAIERPPRQGEGSTLAKQLQHGLSALALVQLEEPQWERVVSMGFAARPGATIQRWLVLELMGRHSNLFLLDAQRRDRQSATGPIGKPTQQRRKFFALETAADAAAFAIAEGDAKRLPRHQSCVSPSAGRG